MHSLPMASVSFLRVDGDETLNCRHKICKQYNKIRLNLSNLESQFINPRNSGRKMQAQNQNPISDLDKSTAVEQLHSRKGWRIC